MNEAITIEETKRLGRRLDVELVHAPHLNGPGGLYDALANYHGWTALRAPVWIGGELVMVVVRPREDE